MTAQKLVSGFTDIFPSIISLTFCPLKDCLLFLLLFLFYSLLSFVHSLLLWLLHGFLPSHFGSLFPLHSSRLICLLPWFLCLTLFFYVTLLWFLLFIPNLSRISACLRSTWDGCFLYDIDLIVCFLYSPCIFREGIEKEKKIIDKNLWRQAWQAMLTGLSKNGKALIYLEHQSCCSCSSELALSAHMHCMGHCYIPNHIWVPSI